MLDQRDVEGTATFSHGWVSGVAGISAGAVYRVLSLMMAEVKN